MSENFTLELLFFISITQQTVRCMNRHFNTIKFLTNKNFKTIISNILFNVPVT